LIVAGAALYKPGNVESTSDLYAIQSLLKEQLGTAAGIIFALALLFSGESSSIIATIVGQVISEGFWYDRWNISPWKRRLVTRCIAIIPCLAVAASVGRTGLGLALNGSQIALSVLLPIISFPLIHFTSSKKLMRMATLSQSGVSSNVNLQEPLTPDMLISDEYEYKDMSKSMLTKVVAWFMWLAITSLNIYLIVVAGLSA
jgi:metal iron transporter